MARKPEQFAVGGRRIALSNLDKVLYPGEKFTKAHVIDYYIRISKYLLPHLRNHPVTLKRFANGKDERDARDKWQLIKTDRTTRVVSTKRDDESALTKRTMKQIALAADARWESNRV